MFLTSVLVLIWINLFKKCYTCLFIIIFSILFVLEIYGIVLKYRHNNEIFKWLLKFEKVRTSNILWQSSVRRLMFLKIQNLFHQTSSPPSKHCHSSSSCSLFDYRCPISFNIKDASFQWLALGCGHVLCSFCLQHVYFGSKPSCPHCRSAIILSDLTIIYI